jgi:histidinol-phosphatase
MEAAAEVARLAGAAALAHFRTALTIETKADGSPVTEADREAEAVAREWIEARFPEDGILGEELGAHRPQAARRWLLDPIDGTKSFVRGVPLWGTLVAVVEGERVLAGAAAFPALDESLAAAPDQGCWWNGRRVTVSAVNELAQSTALVTTPVIGDQGQREGWDRLANRVALARTWGDCYGYLLVATGRAEIMVDFDLKPWDAAPLVPIIEEAGGVFTDWTGVRTASGGDVVATNRGVAEQSRALLTASHAPRATSGKG